MKLISLFTLLVIFIISVEAKITKNGPEIIKKVFNKADNFLKMRLKNFDENPISETVNWWLAISTFKFLKETVAGSIFVYHNS